MSIFPAILTLCADPPSAESIYQITCMRRFLRLHTHLESRARTQGILRDNHNADDVCALRCVQCTDIKVDAIIWESVLMNQRVITLEVNTSWAPPTTRVLHLRACGIEKGVESHRLPRDLEYLFLHACFRLDRTAMQAFDMRALPVNLKELHVLRCSLTGPVDLTSLPPKMQHITISMARITGLYVVNGSLPESLRSAQFSNKFTKIQTLGTSGKKMDQRITCIKSQQFYPETAQIIACLSHMERMKGEVSGK